MRGTPAVASLVVSVAVEPRTPVPLSVVSIAVSAAVADSNWMATVTLTLLRRRSRYLVGAHALGGGEVLDAARDGRRDRRRAGHGERRRRRVDLRLAGRRRRDGGMPALEELAGWRRRRRRRCTCTRGRGGGSGG